MRNYNDTSYDSYSRNMILSRSRSQNHFYIQANQFQKRYQNSLMNGYRLKSSRKCPPCCRTQSQQSNLTYSQTQKQNQGQYGEQQNEYYETSYFKKQQDQQAISHLQKSKRYLEQMVEKSNFNLKVHKERSQNEIETLQKLIQEKDNQIKELNKQIAMLKKISLQTLPNGSTISQKKQDNLLIVEIQGKEQTIKELQRKINRLRQQNSYFREDIQIKNKQIQQLKAKYKLKLENDTNIKKQLQKENLQLKQQLVKLKQESSSFSQKILWFQKFKEQRQFQSSKDKDKINKLESELEILKNRSYQSKLESQMTINRNNEKMITLQNQFMVLRQQSKNKDMQIQSLLTKISAIQAEINFFKDKFTNLLFQIQRQERQSATIYQKAVSLKQQGIKFYESASRIKQNQMMENDSQPRSSRMNNNNWFEPVENRLAESIPIFKGGFGRDTTLFSPSHKNVHKFQLSGNMFESGHQFIHKFPSLNMSFSPTK